MSHALFDQYNSWWSKFQKTFTYLENNLNFAPKFRCKR